MYRVRILLAINDVNEMHKLRSFLSVNGFEVVDALTDGASAIRKIRALMPDITLADSELPAMNGAELARICEEDGLSPVIILKTSDQGQPGTNMFNNYEYYYLYRPLTKSILLQTLQIVQLNNIKIKRLTKKVSSLTQQLEDRKLIEKAKGILMNTYSMNEETAYKTIQRQSMDKGISMKELALNIIEAHK